MKFKAKFKCIMEGGKTKWKTRTFKDAPTFTPKVIDEIQGQKIDTVTISIESQQMDWLDDQDKKDWMDENYVYIILDYKIVPLKSNKKKSSVPFTRDLVASDFEGYSNDIPKDVLEFLVVSAVNLKRMQGGEDAIPDFLTAYNYMKENLDGMDAKTKFKIVFNGMLMGMSAHTSGMTNVLDTINSVNKDNYKDVKMKLLDKKNNLDN